MHRRVDFPCRKGVIRQGGQPVNSHCQQVLQAGTDDAERQIEHQRHDAHKGRDGRIFAGEDPVNAVAAELLLALMGLDNGLSHQLVDKVEPHIRNGSGPVQPALLLHLEDDVLDHFFFVLIQLQGFLNAVVALHQLRGGKTHRDASCLGVVLNEMDDAMDAAVDRTAVVVLATEIQPAWAFLILCHMDGMVYQLIHTLVLGRGDGHHRDAQHGLHLVDADGTAISAHLIHHIQRQHHGGIQLHELHR